MKSSFHILKRRFLKWGWANKIIKFSPKIFVREVCLNLTQSLSCNPIPVSAPYDFLSQHSTKKDVSHDTPLFLSIIFCFLLLSRFLLLRMATMHMARLLCSVQCEVVLFRIRHLLQECRLLLTLIIMKVMFPLPMLC